MPPKNAPHPCATQNTASKSAASMDRRRESESFSLSITNFPVPFVSLAAHSLLRFRIAAPRLAKSMTSLRASPFPPKYSRPFADGVSRCVPFQSDSRTRLRRVARTASVHSNCRSSEIVPRAISYRPSLLSQSYSTPDRSLRPERTRILCPLSLATICVDSPNTYRSPGHAHPASSFLERVRHPPPTKFPSNAPARKSL